MCGAAGWLACNQCVCVVADTLLAAIRAAAEAAPALFLLLQSPDQAVVAAAVGTCSAVWIREGSSCAVV